jgi:hypothetical protein
MQIHRMLCVYEIKQLVYKLSFLYLPPLGEVFLTIAVNLRNLDAFVGRAEN